MTVISTIRRKLEEWRTGVVHATLNPKGQGAARLHLIPPKPSLRSRPHMLFINGWHLIPVGPAWAALLRNFLTELTKRAAEGVELSEIQVNQIVYATAWRMKRLYPRVPMQRLINDLDEIVAVVIAVARGHEVPETLRATMTMADYAKHMTAPHRMDLIVSPLVRNGKWACPLHCKNCYAVQPAMTRDVHELSTMQWKRVIDRCKAIGIPQVCFTGGEPLTRPDIVELVEHAKWHVTRLNTSGVLLTPELVSQLQAASLDAIQITLYSHEPDIHDSLVGVKGAWLMTVNGIRHALSAGLCVSVNTPITRENRSYADTLTFLHSLGVTFVSCSGLIWTGAARASADKDLTSEEMYDILREGMDEAKKFGMELSFTSPGWLAADQLNSLGLATPICGACLSNMAVAPDGLVVPCQSWLNGAGLGNILNMPWRHIWNSPACKRIRKQAALRPDCPLKEEVIR